MIQLGDKMLGPEIGSAIEVGPGDIRRPKRKDLERQRAEKRYRDQEPRQEHLFALPPAALHCCLRTENTGWVFGAHVPSAASSRNIQ